MSIKLVNFENKYLNSYLDFARRSWGTNCYQSNQKYLNWLYKKNPNGSQNFLIAINSQGKVVGSIHKMNMAWQVNHQKIIVPAIHNLLVEDHYRTGYGLFLITASLKGAENILIPGVNPPLSDAYKMLKSQQLNIKHYRKILKPLTGVINFLRYKLLKQTNILNLSVGFCKQCTLNPSEELIDKAVAALQKTTAQQKIAWDRELFRWRFFDPEGPKHLMIYEEQKDFNFIIFSVGQRKGLIIARIIELSVSNPHSFKILFKKAKKVLTRLKVQLIFAYSLENNHDLLYKAVKLKPVKNKKTTSFIYHQDKKNYFENLYLSVAAGDYGLEAINTSISS